MKFSTFALACAGILGVASQSAAPSAPSTCAAQAVLDQCLKDAQALLAQCGAVDYGCECQWQQAISTCYDQCPNDPQATIAAQQVIVYCTAANQTASTSTAASGVSSMASMSSMSMMASSAVPMSSAMAPSASGSASGSASASRSTSDANTEKVSLLAIVVTTLVALL
ncbi:hypothetical protein BZG36_05044 [Bifiguratus adelaidae]|uniref:Extracellular membrane protein CFEM domain-containing protein n=1 Tax=Bifiguratus adelaidae TaxID=1938954 RepID=A0A261XU62_9FUNG|nr:hypothetical protein BZG36_05044 [Bifiguratus adelaidae]